MDEWDPEWDYETLPRRSSVNVPYAMPLGLLIYKSLLDDYAPKTLPAFDPALLTRSIMQFHAGQGLAEIGMIQQLKQHAASQKDSSRREVTPLPTGINWDAVAQSMAWTVGTAAAIAVTGLIGGGPKGRAQGRLGRSAIGGAGLHFNTAQKYGFNVGGLLQRECRSS